MGVWLTLALYKYRYKDCRALDLARLGICKRNMMEKIQGIKGIEWIKDSKLDEAEDNISDLEDKVADKSNQSRKKKEFLKMGIGPG